MLVALSGGVDSALVSLAAFEALGDSAVAVTADYSTLSQEELDSARSVCAEIGMKHMMITYDELENPDFVKNNNDRCFHCRMELGRRLTDLADGMEGSWMIVDGTNLDDLGDYRPGIDAMRQNRVRSPLVEVGFDKQAVRKAAQAAGLSIYDRPSNACLASRIPWGEQITAERLARIEMGERVVRQMSGARQVRVRDVGGSARIEVEPEMISVFDGPFTHETDTFLDARGAGADNGTRGHDDCIDTASSRTPADCNHNDVIASGIIGRPGHAKPRLFDEVSRRLLMIGFDNVVIDPDGYKPGKANDAVSD